MPRETKAEREQREAEEAEKAAEAARLAAEAGGEEPPAPEEATEEQIPQVHVLVERSPEGTVEVDVVATGDVRVTEITDLLRLALIKWDKKSGLGQASR